VIVVATDDFEIYHEVVTELRDRGLTFTTVEAEDDLPERATVVVVGEDDDVTAPAGVEVVTAEPERPRAAIEEVVRLLRGEGGRTVVGIDPGERPGIAVLAGKMVVATFQVPAEQTAAVVREELEDAGDPLVRIGDGARLVGSRIVDDLPDVPVELVDESGTTPYLGTGVRGVGDILAAVNIARIEGERIESRDVDPTAGELQRIKDRSREAGTDNRAIDADLARRVAMGDLSIREALEIHRDADAE
jgi:hypothetical protein